MNKHSHESKQVFKRKSTEIVRCGSPCSFSRIFGIQAAPLVFRYAYLILQFYKNKQKLINTECVLTRKCLSTCHDHEFSIWECGLALRRRYVQTTVAVRGGRIAAGICGSSSFRLYSDVNIRVERSKHCTFSTPKQQNAIELRGKQEMA